MALSDPISITVAGSAKSMPRISSPGTSATYRSADANWGVDIRHRTVTRDKKKRVVSTVGFFQRKVVADPLTSANDYEICNESFQLDRPEVGFSTTEISDQWTGFTAWFTSTILGKIVGMES